MNRCRVIINTRFVEDLEEDLFSENGSKLYDADWSQLVGCNLKVLRDGNSPLRGTVFKFGSMTGSWAGRFFSNYSFVFYQSYTSHKAAQVAFYEPMTSVLTGSQQNPVNVSIVPKPPRHWELQEHHCLIPNEPLQAGLDENSCDDILYAWLSRGVVFTHFESASAILYIFTLPIDYLHALRTAMRSMTKPLEKLPYTKLSSQWRGSLFEVGVW